MNELPTIYMRKTVISDFKVLLIRSWYLLGGGRDFLSAELLTMDVSHTDTSLYFLSLPYPLQLSLI